MASMPSTRWAFALKCPPAFQSSLVIVRGLRVLVRLDVCSILFSFSELAVELGFSAVL
jgi:hypothetical protein